MKEQSSILGTTNPKITLPNKDLVGVKKPESKKEITKEKTKLPKPTGWRMLVLPFRMDEKTKGGILLGGETCLRWEMLVMLIKRDIQMVHGARLVIGWFLLVMQDHE